MIQRGILLREKLLIEDEKSRTEISVNQLSKELVPLVLAQWHRSNAKFSPPVVIQSKSLANKIERLWKRVENVAWGRSNKSETEKVIELLDRLLDVISISNWGFVLDMCKMKHLSELNILSHSLSHLHKALRLF